MSLSRFPIFLTHFPISLSSSCSIYKSTLHITFNLGYIKWICIKEAFILCTHYVVMTSRTLFRICHDIRSSVFLFLLWVHDSFDFLVSYQMNLHSITFVLCDINFPTYITWFSWGLWGFLSPIMTQQMNSFIWCTHCVFMTSLVCHKPSSKSMTQFS